MAMADDPDGPPVPWWPEEVVPKEWGEYGTALEQWKQGDVVLDVPVTWVMPLGEDPIAGTENIDPYESPFASQTSPKVHMVICSQTCDIAAGGPGKHHPFVLAAPLVPGSMIAPENRKSAREYRMGYLVPASPDPGAVAADPQGWFVDFRLIVPLSKGLLLGRTPVQGFLQPEPSAPRDEPVAASDELLGDFAEALAQKFRRPALASVLAEDLPRLIDAYIAKWPEAQAFRRTEQVRLLVEAGTRLEPTTVRVFVLSVAPLDEKQQTMWQGWEKEGRKLLQRSNIALHYTVCIKSTDFSIEQGWKTTPITLKGINSSAGW